MSDAPADASVDAGGCLLPGFGRCPRNTTCVTGRCPDGTPVSCFCSADDQPRCTGACPPSDGGVTCGNAVGAGASGCEAARLNLDPMICRCILGWVWDGRACASLANCHCYDDCSRLYPSREACQTAYARCVDGG